MRRYKSAAILAVMVAAFGAEATAQTLDLPNLPNPAPEQAGSRRSGQQLEALVARIALYPDPLLTDILAASTYPAQVVEAARLAAANAGVQSAGLAGQDDGHHWDPSVQALLNFPDVLRMMDADLDWTDQLGQAVSAQQSEVLDAVQRLRAAAQGAGTLQNGPQESVVNEGGTIALLPPSPQELYLPSYDAQCVYGPGFDGGDCAGGPDDIVWDGGIFLPYGYRQWGWLDWRNRDIRVGGDRNGGAFSRPGAASHDPHRNPSPSGNAGGGGAGGIWRAPEMHHFAPAGMRDNAAFNYAPPAGAYPGRESYSGRERGDYAPAGPDFARNEFARNPIVRGPHSADGFRGPVLRGSAAPALRAAGFAHGGGAASGGARR